MSKSALRKDKTCLNCRHVVEQKFCPNCGQENTDTRKTFHHLFIHFFEDLTHYENAFWRTIINLLFKPSALTKEYLSGKRLSYLAPVRLYIFISFITFLLIAMFPIHVDEDKNESLKTENIEKQTTTITNSLKENKDVKALLDSKSISNEDKKAIQDALNNPKSQERSLIKFGYKSVNELDSIQKYGPKSKKLSDFSYWLNRKVQVIKDKNTGREVIEKFIESFIHNLPKVLFIIMPFFAFFLWIFHNKKRWYYFDHGIFTLHYFSFLLLTFLILFSIGKIGDLINYPLISTIINYFTFIGMVWMFYYFFPAHHRFYGESRIVSFIKSITLLFVNSFFILFLLIVFAFYTFINLH
ncbi:MULTISPECIES: DUF3667 domain-containing protein [unclassified Flavobacterium]|uniref:DUF3667 domain-containing protein n=1 Tax=unclassified Flavobacterium TaxID=196869 RepID=UPI000F0BFB34|nr:MULTISPECIES: DUF3667 domain-containing protein [unclassified Flavobacterium]AYN04602.1 DUF3667 domain-containing protein [Flavobacterium sp. 140616W15]MCD0474604.1 DUF3667 domain-containing protein [Flavobacterium sp. EDS]